MDSLAAVVTDSLRVRSELGLESGSRVLHRRLKRRDVAYVVAGPVSASCYEWYQVYVPYDPARDRDEVFGWVAAASIESRSEAIGSIAVRGVSEHRLAAAWAPGPLLGGLFSVTARRRRPPV